MKIKKIPSSIAIILIVLGLIACSGSASIPAHPSIADTLPNLEYPIDCVSSRKALLKDGTYEEPAAPGSAAVAKVALGNEKALGDINDDGWEDAAVTLTADTGGSGTFTYLALVINDHGTASALPAVLLGDRIRVKSLAIRSGGVDVVLLMRKADEPMSTEPSVETSLTFNLESFQLVETNCKTSSP
jgi:hypothetical protein